MILIHDFEAFMVNGIEGYQAH